MKKKALPLIVLFAFFKTYSQVGINTSGPAATLDIRAKNATGTSTNIDGVLITRVDRQRAQSMTGVPTSTLVYVNSIATGTQTGVAVNMDAVGYYYYDGTAWVKLHNPGNSTAANIYNADGTLTGNRTVSQAGNTLAFTGTATNAFSVDNTTFSVDAANDRIGVGTTTPDTRLTVSTPDNSFGLNHTNGTINLKTYIGAGSGYLGTTTANDFKLMTNNTARVTVTSGGDIGINNAIPASNLDITAKNATGTSTTVEGVLIIRVDRQRAQSMTGVPTSTLVYVNSIATGTQTGVAVNMDAVGYYYYDGTAWVKLHNPTNSTAANIYNADGTLTGNRTVSQAGNTLAFTGTATNAFSVDNTTFSVDAANDRVGVGTTTPDTRLTVSTPDNSFGLNHTNGTINLKTFIGGGSGYLGTTTANDFKLMTNNTAKVTVTSGGDVGIGTSSPDTKLTIVTPDNSYGLNHSNGTINLKTFIGGDSAYMGTTTANNLNVMTNNAIKMTITPTGNIGVNTSSPSAVLDILSKGTTNATKALEINDSTNNELLQVADDGTVRLEKYKDIGVLGTDANGFLIDGSNLNIPSIATIGLANVSANHAANNSYTVAFTVNKNNAANITYNNGNFTINKAGYYNFSVFVKYDISMNSPTGGSAVTSLLKNGSSFSYNVSGHGDGTSDIGHNLAGTQFFNVGDVVRVTANYTRTFRITQGSMSIVYYGT